MQIGIFENTFKRPTLEATLDAVAAAGLKCAQLHMSTLGLPAMPDAVADEVSRADTGCICCTQHEPLLSLRHLQHGAS